MISVAQLELSPVSVLPPTAPSRSPTGGLPKADFGAMIVIVPSVWKLLAGSAVPTVVSEITNTAGTPASASVPYSNVGDPVFPVVIPT